MCCGGTSLVSCVTMVLATGTRVSLLHCANGCVPVVSQYHLAWFAIGAKVVVNVWEVSARVFWDPERVAGRVVLLPVSIYFCLLLVSCRLFVVMIA